MSSKGSAFLYVKKDLQSTIHPTVISHNYKQGFQNEFLWTGTRDPSAYISLQAALEFRKSLTDTKVYEYNNLLCKQAGKV